MPMASILEHFTSASQEGQQKKEPSNGSTKNLQKSKTMVDHLGVKSILAEKIVYDLTLKLIDL